jgi:hypothetical protein
MNDLMLSGFCVAAIKRASMGSTSARKGLSETVGIDAVYRYIPPAHNNISFITLGERGSSP